MAKTRIMFFTSTRADYGILRGLISKVKEHPSFELLMLVSGAHLSSSSGASLEEIKKDGIPITDCVEIDLFSNTGVGMAKSTGLAIIGFSDAVSRLSPDIIVLLGDRFETMAMSQVAMFLRIPVAHIHGGEISLGSIDDPIRHSITKMSDFHFVTCQEYKERVIQLGEHPSQVFDVGSLSVEMIMEQKFLERDEIFTRYNIFDEQKICILSLHPATASSENIIESAKNIIKTLDQYPDLKIFVSFSNFEPDGKDLNKLWEDFCNKQKDRVVLSESFGSQIHLSLMKHASMMIGNSSSGIIEAASFKLPVINIGNRQKGRMCSKNVIHSDGDIKNIKSSVEEALSFKFKRKISNLINPYYKPNTSENIINQLLLLEPLKACEFYDLKDSHR